MAASGTTRSTSGRAARPSGAFTAVGEYAGFWRRFLASFIDATLLVIARFTLGRIVNSIGLDFLTDPLLSSFDLGRFGLFLPVGSIVTTAIGFLYFGYFESSAWQATLGKQALGIYVTGMDGERISPARAIGRHAASWLSDAFFLIGYLIQPFTHKRQALHDVIASTLVLKR